MPFHVYILRCSDASYYTGHTDKLEARLSAHEQGTIHGYTQKRRPVRLVFTEELPTRQDAIARERQIKGWSRAKKEALIARDWNRLIMLSQSSSSTARTTTPDNSIGP
ncbi:MAG: GIY-YIG nuclease family protein [Chloroflexi bacterium]|nr:GIY-YIG nuclease family protein [Chloroflexota bacterium]